MPFDSARLETVRAALGPLWNDYRESAAIAAEEVTGILKGASVATGEDRKPSFAARFGALGSAHINVDRLAPLFEGEPALSGPASDAVEAAGAVLGEIVRESDQPTVDLPVGASLTEAVRRALARVGRAFGAAHVVALARSGRFDSGAHKPWLDAYPFSRWTRRERQLAPPLVVILAGSDLLAGGLSEFLDGAAKLVLLVRDEAAPPAPLVRLISPATYVAQIHDDTPLDRFAGWSGPGALAWVPESSAAFVHDPAAGPALGARLQILSAPPVPRRGLGGQSATQLAEELRQLEAIAALTVPATAPPEPVRTESENRVDRLAAWLLSQANVTDGGVETEP